MATHLADCSLFLVLSESTNHTIWRILLTHTWIDLFIINDEAALNFYKQSEAPFVNTHDFTEIGYKCLRPPKTSNTFCAKDLKNVNRDLLSSVINANLERLFPSDSDIRVNNANSVSNVNTVSSSSNNFSNNLVIVSINPKVSTVDL